MTTLRCPGSNILPPPNGPPRDLPRPPQKAPASNPKFSGRVPNAHANPGPQFPRCMLLPSLVTGPYSATGAPVHAADSTPDISLGLEVISGDISWQGPAADL